MAFVIAEPCVGTCDTSCVEVCPVDCIAGELEVDDIKSLQASGDTAKLATLQLFIDPDICIDCGACEHECPVEAIFADTDVPDEEMEWIERNETESLELEIATGDSPVLAD